MDVVVSRCAGIDIGKAEVVVCLRIPGPRGKRVSQVRTFSAVAVEMNRLADWLAEHQVSHAVWRRPVRFPRFSGGLVPPLFWRLLILVHWIGEGVDDVSKYPPEFRARG